MVRAIRNFNLENRAEREISKMKPSPAPRHPSTKSLLREQMSSKWCRGAGGRLAGSGCGLVGGAARVDVGPVAGARSPGRARSAEHGKVEPPAGDIEPVPFGRVWSRRLRLLRSGW